MPSATDFTTTLSSTALRACAYAFLRWIPGHHFVPAFYALLAVYIPSFIYNFRTTSPYKIISDELDVIVKETVDRDASEELELLDGADEGPIEEIDVEETIVLEEKDPHILRTLLTGLPSPTSIFWSLVTLGINLALVGMVTDYVYRAPLLHQAHDLSFARVGYVSGSTANILVREPKLSELPIYVSYRNADPPLSVESGQRLIDTSWKSEGTVDHLTEDTDYTAAIRLKDLRPDTRYQYALSNNHTGYFTTAPRVGVPSKRNGGKFTFLHTSCIKPRFPYDPRSHPLAIPGFEHLSKWIPKLKASFMLFLGDFIYIDVPKRMGSDIETYRREYRQVYSSPDWPGVSAELPWIHVLDDHEIANDWDANTTGVYEAAVDPWHHYQTSVNPPAVRPGATYFTFTSGPASFFLLDTRRHRDATASKPATDPSKTMLGTDQLASLLTFLSTPAPPGVRWKIVVSSIPFTKNWRFNADDTWAGYLAERARILEAMWDVGLRGGVGVVVLSGDRHEFAATAFPPPAGGRWPLSATVHEFSTSPASMFWIPWRTYEQKDDEDVKIKYIPAGNSKFGAVEIASPPQSDQSLLTYRLFVDGAEAWTYLVTSPPPLAGAGRNKDAIWG
ncbi:hypothetical protein B0A49_12892 [Cryomyces minteri]|uniref:PhoD-like phosphatase metallophosphatase domain-containing protein n=2 Tax=Cryomyces minteri TaxID=331657 RepID=A0A4U0VUR4_9PEZI|nr:hypothetical protein B0A49_12892 [Cryomyces minteri]